MDKEQRTPEAEAIRGLEAQIAESDRLERVYLNQRGQVLAALEIGELDGERQDAVMRYLAEMDTYYGVGAGQGVAE
jgi:hypothetical protein